MNRPSEGRIGAFIASDSRAAGLRGGDSDTIAAIAGGIAEARFGIPADIAAAGWAFLPADNRGVMMRLYEAAGSPLPAG